MRSSTTGSPEGRTSRYSVKACGALALAAIVAAVPANAQFTIHTVATGLRFGYQTVIADLNRDQRLDIIGLGAQMSELVWFENPSWERHLLVGDVGGMINLDTADIDADGIPEIALGYGYGMSPARSAGNVAILRHSGDPTEPWTLTEIDAIPMSHRLRFGIIDDSGVPVLINAPMLNPGASGMADPDRLPTPLVYYRAGSPPRESITDQNQGVVHGLLPWDIDGDGRDEVLTAGRLGIHVHRYEQDGRWSRHELSGGVPEPYPDGGSSDLAAGVIDGAPLLAAIEPFHGNQVVVYRRADGGAWQRTVIDTELVNGHSLAVADFDADGTSEIVAAGTRGPKNLYLYRLDAAAGAWQRTVIDDAISANSCATGDIDGDGDIDLSCIDASAPFSLKWYENTGVW